MTMFIATGICETSFGSVVHMWTEKGLFRLRFSLDADSELDAIEAQRRCVAHRDSRELTSRLADYFEGQMVDFGKVPVDPSGWSPFYSSVYRACREIELGQTISYGELARRSGSPLAARAVGQAMARNRIPLIIPCHRVVGTSGRLTGFSAPGGLDTKRLLLGLESSEKNLLSPFT